MTFQVLRMNGQISESELHSPTDYQTTSYKIKHQCPSKMAQPLQKRQPTKRRRNPTWYIHTRTITRTKTPNSLLQTASYRYCQPIQGPVNDSNRRDSFMKWTTLKFCVGLNYSIDSCISLGFSYHLLFSPFPLCFWTPAHSHTLSGLKFHTLPWSLGPVPDSPSSFQDPS
jgi:hypothetical protein